MPDDFVVFDEVRPMKREDVLNLIVNWPNPWHRFEGADELAAEFESARMRALAAALASPEEASPEPYTAGKGMSEYDRLSHKGAVDERDF